MVEVHLSEPHLSPSAAQTSSNVFNMSVGKVHDAAKEQIVTLME